MEADRLTMMRRDYGAAPKGQALSKVQERRLREQGSAELRTPMLQHDAMGDDCLSEDWDNYGDERCAALPMLLAYRFCNKTEHPSSN